MRSRKLRPFLGILVGLTLPGVSLAFGGAPASSTPPAQSSAPTPTRPGKLVIALSPVQNVQIEMPDGTIHDFGSDFQASLVTKFTQSGRYIIADPLNSSLKAQLSAIPSSDPEYQWSGTYLPVATVSVNVNALSFRTGSRGEGSFYGFDDRIRTPFNDGTLTNKNEFPLRSVTFDPNWFDRTFDVKGTMPFDSTAGLDLGDGISINVLFAWLTLNYAQYRSNLDLSVGVDASALGRNEVRDVSVTGTGYFYDLSGQYLAWSAGISLARKDAMNQVLKKAIDGAYASIERAVVDLPLVARVDHVLTDGTILLGTGQDAGVVVGTLYEMMNHPGAVIQVTSSVHEGSIGHLVQGDIAWVEPGSVLKQVNQMPPAPAPSLASARAQTMALTGAPSAPTLQAVEQISLPSENLAQPELGSLAPTEDWATATWRSILGTATLPYRVYRYFAYDQAYGAAADNTAVLDMEKKQLDQIGQSGYDTSSELGQETQLMDLFNSWASDAARSDMGRQIGLDSIAYIPPRALTQSAQERLAGGTSPVVAVIDSGVDYNHPIIHSSLWLNPNPTTDRSGAQDLYGWDYFSNDSRPYDDGYHGTQIASTVLAVAPNALIMPLKVFNPWGITSSAAIYGAFRYAADHGAQIIVCGWSTKKPSKAIEMGVAYAQSKGVLVVAAAGDLGNNLAQVPSYPASLSKSYDNVLTVASVDKNDSLVKVSGHYSNFDAGSVRIAAPGQSIHVAEPRMSQSIETSTGIAAATVAGAAARQWAELAAGGATAPDYARLIDAIRSRSAHVSGLTSFVQDGLSLRF